MSILPTSATSPISIDNLITEFGLSSNQPIGFDTLYGKTTGVNVSGAISLSNFYNKRKLAMTQTTLANDIGAAGRAPWNTTYPDDASARLIWNDTNAPSSTAAGWITFQSMYYNNTNNPISGTIYVSVDNLSKFYLNKALIMNKSGWNPASSCNVSILPGSNLLEFAANNYGPGANPAMLAYFLKDGANVLIRSDNSNAALANATLTYCSTTNATEPVIS